jgi:3-isopropylmalate dehydrogenase
MPAALSVILRPLFSFSDRTRKMNVNRKHVLVLPGDGIGPEVTAEALKLLPALQPWLGCAIETTEADIGGIAYDRHGTPLTDETLALACAADAVLLGAVGGPNYDTAPRDLRPERGLLRLRAGMGVYANLRPAIVHQALASASTLKPEVVSGLDILIVRELTGGLYFGHPRGLRQNEAGRREGFNTLVYSEDEVARIAHVAFRAAQGRNRRLCSVDKANVLECSELWRTVVEEVAREYPQVALEHMYVDNAAMQLVRDPKRFDVLLTENMFGDILSDLASMLTGSIGLLPSASVDAGGRGLYEPIHGSAPDIAGLGVANPLATILSLAMLLRHSLAEPAAAEAIEAAVTRVLDLGIRTRDIGHRMQTCASTTEMGDAVLWALGELAKEAGHPAGATP